MYKLIIAGSRDFDNWSLLQQETWKFIDQICSKNTIWPEDIQVVSGCARGADTLGEKFSRHELKREPIPYPANWAKFGKKAGAFRNSLMARNSDGLIAFWDGMSKGTENMILNASVHKLKDVKVIQY